VRLLREGGAVRARRDGPDLGGDGAGVAPGVALALEHEETGFEIVARERRTQMIEDVRRALPVMAHRAEPGVERGAVEQTGLHRSQRRERLRLVDRHLAVGADGADPEADGRPVPFADAPERQHEPDPAGRCRRLVGVHDDARVAQGRGLDGELVRERGAEQQPALGAELDVGVEAVADPLGVAAERRRQVLMAVAEASDHLGEPVLHLGLVEGEEPGDDARGARLAAADHLLPGDEEPRHHPGRVGRQPDRAPLGERPAGHAAAPTPTPHTTRACCRVAISAKVDSAPWFSLRPPGSRPS
jgi:hypothetical protein